MGMNPQSVQDHVMLRIKPGSVMQGMFLNSCANTQDSKIILFYIKTLNTNKNENLEYSQKEY